MFCQVTSFPFGDSLLGLWGMMTLSLLSSMVIMSATAFYFYYWPGQVTYEKWRYKVGL